MDKDQHARQAAQATVIRPAVSGLAGIDSLLPGDAMLAAMGGTPPTVYASMQRADGALQLASDQDYFNDLYLLAPVGYFVLAGDTTILQMNLVGADLLGLPRDNPDGIGFRQFIAQRFTADFDAFVSNSLSTEEPQRMALQMTRGRGDRGFAVTLLGSGTPGASQLRVVLEMAEGKLAALEKSEERFRRIVHSAEEGIWEIDAAARTSFVNPKMAAMLGYTIEAMLEQPLVAFMDDEGRSLLERNIARRQQGMAERHEFKFLRKDGSEMWATLATNPIFDADGSYLGALALVSDITERKLSSELIWHQANYDALTALPNRNMFQDRLAQEMKKARRDGLFLALLFIDLDQFKEINDRLGHEMGDALLVEAARRIAACVRASDTLARLGGDEFVVILPGLDQVSNAERVAQQIIAALNRPFLLGESSGSVSASIGIALHPSDANDPEQLLRNADQAMYAAKNAGRNRYSYFTPDMQAAAQLRLRITHDLQMAVSNQQFELHYQPIVNLHTGAIERAEALLRWRHPERGMLNPAEFIGSAEASGVILEIGDWVFRHAADQAKRWQEELGRPFQISVNQSPVQFRLGQEFFEEWMRYVERLGLAPRSIVIEITERLLLDESGPVMERLRQFRSMGLQVALDDFGTGHSVLAHLKKFDIDYLKIDRSFVMDLAGDSGDLALCEGIIVMAHKLGLKVVAEGVETETQLNLLKAAGCDYAQGYVYAHPMPPAQMGAMARGPAKLAN
ncbi:putative bifunctional diguanylate cyclase/phosphodiesterase [Pseudoduganella violaceinigra]|uniref:putative bifunctional diguanylate cyclase/phosphodiesterase n=1 Tax=Pseudoduganella violaceinigra TaxID=246602 RepID=UPI0003FDCDDB|nr:EAL domain-containing protein [Pseudoduganella violaceinigra]